MAQKREWAYPKVLQFPFPFQHSHSVNIPVNTVKTDKVGYYDRNGLYGLKKGRKAKQERSPVENVTIPISFSIRIFSDSFKENG